MEGIYPHVGPAWGHGPMVEIEEARPVGADSARILHELGGYSVSEIEDLIARGVTGTPTPATVPRMPGMEQIRIDRGDLSRVDAAHDGWRTAARTAGRLS